MRGLRADFRELRVVASGLRGFGLPAPYCIRYTAKECSAAGPVAVRMLLDRELEIEPRPQGAFGLIGNDQTIPKASRTYRVLCSALYSPR